MRVRIVVLALLFIGIATTIVGLREASVRDGAREQTLDDWLL